MAMSNLLGYNATEGLVNIFLLLFQANIYCFLLKSAVLAEGIKDPSQSLQVKCQGNLLGCHKITGWTKLEWASGSHPVQPLAQVQSPRASCPGTAFPLSRLGWDASNGGGSTTWASVCAHCLWFCHWAALRRAWLCPLCSLPSGIYLDDIPSKPPLFQAKQSQLYRHTLGFKMS